MTVGQKNLLFILFSIALFLVSFFLIFQKNMENAANMETKIDHMQSEITRLGELQTQVGELKPTAVSHQELVNDFTDSFPSTVPQESALYKVYRMMVKSGVTVSAIRPGQEQTFLFNGKFFNFDGRSDTSAASPDTLANKQETEVEKNPETRASLHEMVGKTVGYEVEVTGTQKEIMKAIDWVADNDQPMSITNLSLSFDSSTGKLSGTMMIYYHALNGNGIAYTDPVDIDDFQIGTDTLFGVLKK